MDIFERLDVPREQRFEFEPMVAMGGDEALLNGQAKRIKDGIIASIEAFLVNKTPEPFNKVQMR